MRSLLHFPDHWFGLSPEGGIGNEKRANSAIQFVSWICRAIRNQAPLLPSFNSFIFWYRHFACSPSPFNSGQSINQIMMMNMGIRRSPSPYAGLPTSTRVRSGHVFDPGFSLQVDIPLRTANSTECRAHRFPRLINIIIIMPCQSRSPGPA